jgi:hypothetical protein
MPLADACVLGLAVPAEPRAELSPRNGGDGRPLSRCARMRRARTLLLRSSNEPRASREGAPVERRTSQSKTCRSELVLSELVLPSSAPRPEGPAAYVDE